MKRRLYFLLPGTEMAQRLHRDLLLARIPEKHMHVIADDDSRLHDLPAAGLLQRSDVIHAIQLGIPLGGMIGILIGALAVFSDWVAGGFEGRVMMATMLAGIIIGTWSSTMIAVDIPNSRHRNFEHAIRQGQLLFIVDVPVRMVDEINEMVARQYPEVEPRGVEPNIPVFP